MYSWNPIGIGRWTEYAWSKPKAGAGIIDPYLVWADLTNFADLGRRPTLIPVLLKLSGPAAEFVNEIDALPDLNSCVRISPLYRIAPGDDENDFKDATYCTALVSAGAFDALDKAQEKLAIKVEAFQLGLPISGAEDVQPLADQAASMPPMTKQHGEPRVVVGVIDEGFAFVHERFREPGGGSVHGTTRIGAFWDQGEGWKSFAGRIRPVPYGTEVHWRTIDARLAAYAGPLDEQALYRALNYRGVERRTSHGTHVMDVLCGDDALRTGRPSSLPPVVCVALPKQTTGDTSGLSLGVYALDGLRYVVDRADRLVPEAKVVVNMSYGAIAGPHDGSSLLEAAIDELIRLRHAKRGADSLAVVIPAGNNHLSRCHAQFELAAGEAWKTLAWRILPDDATPSFLEIWLPADADPAQIVVKVAPPAGDANEEVSAGTARAIGDGDAVVGTIVHFATADRPMILVAVAPTATLDANRRVAPFGVWRVSIGKRGGDSVNVNAWIQRDDNVRGFRRRGRQSYFDDPDYARLDGQGRVVEKDDGRSYVRRAGTLNSIATGKHTVVVGGYRTSDGAAALYSARGPEAAQEHFRAGPDLMAVCERSATRRGVLAAGTRSGSVIAMNGTSVAAPHVARWIVDRLMAGEQADRNAVRTRARRDDPDAGPPTSAQKPGPAHSSVKPRPPVEQAGAGRLRSVPRGEGAPDTVLPFARADERAG